VLEITKDCAPCPFIDTLRPGLQARITGRRGMLARVLATGTVRRGDLIALLR
jgi:MOSC domain-containing protein YiiM